MLYQIVACPSGWYAAIWNDGTLFDGALQLWDGKRGTNYPYNVNASPNTRYYINAKNDVYYQVDGGDTGLFCAGKKLNAHCQHLQAIKAR